MMALNAATVESLNATILEMTRIIRELQLETVELMARQPAPLPASASDAVAATTTTGGNAAEAKTEDGESGSAPASPQKRAASGSSLNALSQLSGSSLNPTATLRGKMAADIFGLMALAAGGVSGVGTLRTGDAGRALLVWKWFRAMATEDEYTILIDSGVEVKGARAKILKVLDGIVAQRLAKCFDDVGYDRPKPLKMGVT